MRRDKYGRAVCECGGYWFPHRKGGGACDHSKSRDIHMAIRHGQAEQLLDALIAYAFTYPKKLPLSQVCPF